MEQFCLDCGQSLTKRKFEDIERLYCKNCSQIKWQNPKPVAWTVLQKDEKLLLVKRAEEPDKGEWDIPDGFLEINESFRTAAVRELEEETKFKADENDLELLETVAFERSSEHVVGVVFHKEIDEKPDFEARDDAEEAGFWNLQELINNKNESLRDICKDVLLSSL